MWTFYNTVQAHSPDSGDKSRVGGQAEGGMPPNRLDRGKFT
jgi:hypothetical protein